MAEGKTNQELLLELEMRKLLFEEKKAQIEAHTISKGSYNFTFTKGDLVKGIILREILGPPKASEG